MATTSVNFQPTTRTFGDLYVENARDFTGRHRHALVNALIGLSFILVFIAALSGLYLADQTFFTKANVATASAPAATYHGMPVDYD